jgi:hypothetical protein
MRDRARYGVDGGYGGVPFFFLVGAGLLTGARWAHRRDKPLVSSAAKMGIMAVLAVAAGYFYRTGPGKRTCDGLRYGSRCVRRGRLDDERCDRDELTCRGGAYEGMKDLVIAEHRWEGVGPPTVI